MKTLIASLFVSIVLAVLVLYKSTAITRGFYQLGSLLGIATFALLLLNPAATWTIYFNRASPVSNLALLFVLSITPFVLLIEASVLGYRGFTSWFRYLFMGTGALGAVALTLSVLLPKLLRR